MRTALLSLALFVPLSSGCSALIADSGTKLGALETREEVHRLLGEPVASGEVRGKPYEEFISRRKYSDGVRALSYRLGFVMTVGLSELVCCPAELMMLGRITVMGQNVRIVYNTDEKVDRWFLDESWGTFRDRLASEPVAESDSMKGE